MTRFTNYRCANLAIAVLLWLAAASTPAFAHRVTVFAWVDGNTIHTQSKFSGGKKVVNGTIEVYDTRDHLLVSGKTDDQGEFAFPIPQKEDLKIVMIAGTGHRNQWVVKADEMGGVTADAPAPATTPQASGPKDPAAGSTGVDQVQIQQAVEKALDKKLAPIMRTLAEMQAPGPSLSDILGGIGYILGLMGIGAYVHARRRLPGKDGS